MTNIFIALGIGICAGIIDIIPMLIQKLEKSAIVAAFIHWVALGLIIPFVSWNIAPWLQGLIIGELMALPVIAMIFKQDKKAALPILVMSAILGIGVAFAGSKFIG